MTDNEKKQEVLPTKVAPVTIAAEDATTAQPLLNRYRGVLRRWEMAAGFWLLMWFLLAAGGIVASMTIVVNPPFLRDDSGNLTAWGYVFGLYAVAATGMSGFVKPWRFHRGYQRAAYKLETAIEIASVQTSKAKGLPRVADACRKLILEAGSELDATDGVQAKERPRAALKESGKDEDE